MTRLTLYTGAGCSLCEEVRAALAPWSAARRIELELKDVGADPLLQRRYGLSIPVLMLDGAFVCAGRLDLDALERRLAAPV